MSLDNKLSVIKEAIKNKKRDVASRMSLKASIAHSKLNNNTNFLKPKKRWARRTLNTTGAVLNLIETGALIGGSIAAFLYSPPEFQDWAMKNTFDKVVEWKMPDLEMPTPKVTTYFATPQKGQELYSKETSLTANLFEYGKGDYVHIPSSEISTKYSEFERIVSHVEDRSLEERIAVNPKSVLKAAYENYKYGTRRGASTLPMQVASLIIDAHPENFSKDQKGGYIRKLFEARIAINLVNNYTPDEIFAAYINHMNFTGNIIGAGTFAKQMFQEDLSELSLDKYVYMAGLFKAPNAYNIDNSVTRLKNEFIRHPEYSVEEKIRKIDSIGVPNSNSLFSEFEFETYQLNKFSTLDSTDRKLFLETDSTIHPGIERTLTIYESMLKAGEMSTTVYELYKSKLLNEGIDFKKVKRENKVPHIIQEADKANRIEHIILEGTFKPKHDGTNFVLLTTNLDYQSALEETTEKLNTYFAKRDHNKRKEKRETIGLILGRHGEEYALIGSSNYDSTNIDFSKVNVRSGSLLKPIWFTYFLNKVPGAKVDETLLLDIPPSQIKNRLGLTFEKGENELEVYIRAGLNNHNGKYGDTLTSIKRTIVSSLNNPTLFSYFYLLDLQDGIKGNVITKKDRVDLMRDFWSFAAQFGIKTGIETQKTDWYGDLHGNAILGTFINGPSPREIATAYNVLGNRGEYHETYLIQSISNNGELQDIRQKEHYTLDKQTIESIDKINSCLLIAGGRLDQYLLNELREIPFLRKTGTANTATYQTVTIDKEELENMKFSGTYKQKQKAEYVRNLFLQDDAPSTYILGGIFDGFSKNNNTVTGSELTKFMGELINETYIKMKLEAEQKDVP